MLIYDEPRTLVRSTPAANDRGSVIRTEIKWAEPDPNSKYAISSVIHDEPPLVLAAAEAVSYLVSQHAWDKSTAETLLAALGLGDQMIPDEEYGAEERLLRVE